MKLTVNRQALNLVVAANVGSFVLSTVGSGGGGGSGPAGDSAYQIAVDNGFVGTEAEWLASLEGSPGLNGDSAYQVAVENGFVGTEAEWLASLEGSPGAAGDSAYQIAVDNGFVGTEAQWLTSLHIASGARRPALSLSGYAIIAAINNTSLSNVALYSGRSEYTPFTLTVDTVIGRLECDVTTAAAGTTCRLAIYDSNANGSPHQPIVSTGDISTATNGNNLGENVTHTTLLAGQQYWMAILSSGSVTYRSFVAGANNPLNTTDTTGNVMGFLRLGGSYASGFLSNPMSLGAAPAAGGTPVVKARIV